MKIEIETPMEAKVVAQALLEFIKNGLEVSGHATYRTDEQNYYTVRRQTMHQLERFLSS